MIARARYLFAPLLIALLGSAPALADRDSNGHDGERSRDAQDGKLRDSYDYRRERQDQRQQQYREQHPPRSYPQPGYPNPVAPGYYRHDPYRNDPGRNDRYRNEPYGRQPGRDNDYDRGYDRNDRDYERQRDGEHGNYERQRPLRPVNDVVRQVEGTYGGKVVGVQQAGSDYRVRVLQRDGRVKTVTVPAH